MSSPESRGMHLESTSRLNVVAYSIKNRVFANYFGSQEMGDPTREVTPEEVGGLINDVIASLAREGLLDQEACEAQVESSEE